jgi:hypothetical protein
MKQKLRDVLVLMLAWLGVAAIGVLALGSLAYLSYHH